MKLVLNTTDSLSDKSSQSKVTEILISQEHGDRHQKVTYLRSTYCIPSTIAGARKRVINKMNGLPTIFEPVFSPVSHCGHFFPDEAGFYRISITGVKFKSSTPVSFHDALHDYHTYQVGTRISERVHW